MSFFLGVQKTDQLEEHLKSASLYDRELLLVGESYLKEKSCKGKIFLGKELPPMISLEELLLIDRHIRSILSRLCPRFSLAKESIELVACNPCLEMPSMSEIVKSEND